MKVKWVNWCPVFIIYTEKFLKGYGGHAWLYGPLCFILINPKYREDLGLLHHELTHVEQHHRSWWFHTYNYATCTKYRLESEAEAFAVQLTYAPAEKCQEY